MSAELYAVIVHGQGNAARAFGPLGEADAFALAGKLNQDHYPRYYAEVRPMWDADDAAIAVPSMEPRTAGVLS